MYGKIKYFIYAAFILIIVFVIMDASNRYTKMAEQKNPQQTIQDEAFRRAQLAVENQTKGIMNAKMRNMSKKKLHRLQTPIIKLFKTI